MCVRRVICTHFLGTNYLILAWDEINTKIVKIIQPQGVWRSVSRLRKIQQMKKKRMEQSERSTLYSFHWIWTIGWSTFSRYLVTSRHPCWDIEAVTYCRSESCYSSGDEIKCYHFICKIRVAAIEGIGFTAPTSHPHNA